MGRENIMRSSLVEQFNKILSDQNYKHLAVKKESLLREYLQVKILEKIYNQKQSAFLYFIGGTSLRLLRDLDRFSEDLDFDLDERISFKEVEKIFDNLVKQLELENIAVEPYKNKAKKRIYFELRFPKVLYELSLSSNQSQKLVIKLDFEKFWQGIKREVVVLNRFGYLFKVVTIPINQILGQKLYAYIKRKQTLPRDIYDVVWLLSNNARLDWNFLDENKIRDLVTCAREKFLTEKNKLKTYIERIKPLLEFSGDAKKIAFFEYYFPEIKDEKQDIEFIGLEKKEDNAGYDYYQYIFTFLIRKERRVKFIIKVNRTALVTLEEKIEDRKEFYSEKIKTFLLKNPIKDYMTKIITTVNKTYFLLGSFEEIME